MHFTITVDSHVWEFTASDLLLHNTPDDYWVVLDGKVYDVTLFLDLHPAGRNIIIDNGPDITRGFLGIGHPERAYDYLSDLVLGDFIEDPVQEATTAHRLLYWAPLGLLLGLFVYHCATS
ncbi:cytochrome b5-like heme/steroid binding domain-containing protein [Favolaschia claudopus]|uniref:Cytochrome b5-like heme/steroid binding domain-containing protein n=1 Tax=Favolaschia claudopus TaxID=2862362 RepID=A0AAW0AJ07_9AGAR